MFPSGSVAFSPSEGHPCDGKKQYSEATGRVVRVVDRRMPGRLSHEA